MAENKAKYRTEIQQVSTTVGLDTITSSLFTFPAMKVYADTTQMMFVSGETADVAPETTSMIEGIVQQQVTEMVCTSFLLSQQLLTLIAHTSDSSCRA